ncbi:hypothetical protein MMC10_008788 [Thelotrema lepadinum]|nr:hypothetical protein [Thelotrema lepadinum]
MGDYVCTITIVNHARSALTKIWDTLLINNSYDIPPPATIAVGASATFQLKNTANGGAQRNPSGSGGTCAYATSQSQLDAMFIYACATPASGVLNKYTAASTNKALTIVSTPFQQQGTPLNVTATITEA